MRNEQIKALTYGAVLGAIYALLVLLMRAEGGVSGFFNYLIPIPLAIYTNKYKTKNGLIALFTYSLLSFLIIDVYKVVLFCIPNLILGFLIPTLIKKLNPKLAYVSLFLCCFVLEFATYIGYAKLRGIDILVEMELFINMMVKYGGVSLNKAKQMVYLIYPSTYVMISIVKILFVIVFYRVLSKRLHLTDDCTKPLSLTFNKYIGIVGILFTVLSGISTYLVLQYDNLAVSILFSITFTLYVVMIIYLFYQGVLFISTLLKIKNTIIRVLFSLLTIFLFPITIIAGIISNFILGNKQRKEW